MPHLYSVLNKWFDVKIIWLGALIIQNNKHVVFKMILLKKSRYGDLGVYFTHKI